MRILVCGGRDSKDWSRVCLWLDKLRPTTVITGCATGVDEFARTWAGVRNVMAEVYSADWASNGKKAGPIRNQQMLDKGKPDMVLAFPGGKGTADMVWRARRRGTPVMEIP